MATTLERYEEHQFKRVISGHVEAVRSRVCDVLEEFGYTVLGDNPIQAKRRRRRNLWTANILEYQTQLTIALKPISDASILATFNYEVEYLFTKGDRLSLEREAEAIIALATRPLSSALCTSCGVENEATARFCRICGKPAESKSSHPETELMRLSADASAAHLESMVAILVEIVTLAIGVPMIFFGPHEVANFGWAILGIGQLLVVLVLLQATHRLRCAVKAEFGDSHDVTTRTLREPSKALLPPQQFSVTEGLPRRDSFDESTARQISVTEGTTELMDSRENTPASS